MINWDAEMVSKLFNLKRESLTYDEIAEMLNNDFEDCAFTGESVRHKYRRLKDSYLESVNTEPEIEEIEEDLELKEAERIAHKLQRERDTQRVERSVWRNNARQLLLLEELNNKVLESLEALKGNMTYYALKEKYNSKQDSVGIVHLTDLHLNELISQADNTYDFEVASKRLQKLADKAIKNFTDRGIKKVIIAFTGDIIGSDRRLEERMNLASNRSQALFVAFKLLSKFIYEFSKQFQVTVFSVAGNEARVTEARAYAENVVTDNYDITLHNMLYYFFKESPIEVFRGNPNEVVFSINGNNILLLHGASLSLNSFSKSISEVIAKYNRQGVSIRYVLCGHYHEPHTSIYFSRGGSLVGSNSYSYFGLNLASRASQSVYFVTPDGDIDALQLDLQNTDGYSGYDMSEEIKGYNLLMANNKKLQIFSI